MPAPRIAIVGGGIAGLSAAYELNKQGLPFTLFEAGPRLGGIVETKHHDGFVMECGPDGWVSDKPWATELALELGLKNELIASNDAIRVTWILRDGMLYAIPDGMRMMVPTNLDAIRSSALFSPAAMRAYEQEPNRAGELKQYAEQHANEDESIASFTQRHFGEEATNTIAAPLLAGVFGGNVDALSVQAVMPQFVAMEREYGSLILALQAQNAAIPARSIFTSLRNGLGSLIDAMVRSLPPHSIRLNTPVTALHRKESTWVLQTNGASNEFDAVFLATPVHIARSLMTSIDSEAAALLEMNASSAVLAGLAFEHAGSLKIPGGFGVLIPGETQSTDLLAATFVDQKFPNRVPGHGRILRAFFGSATAQSMQSQSDAYIAAVAQAQLGDLLGQPLPEPSHIVVRRLPNSLPQYEVGHLSRMRRLDERIALYPGLKLLGNAYHGVGLPDLVRDGRAAARTIAQK